MVDPIPTVPEVTASTKPGPEAMESTSAGGGGGQDPSTRGPLGSRHAQLVFQFNEGSTLSSRAKETVLKVRNFNSLSLQLFMKG